MRTTMTLILAVLLSLGFAVTSFALSVETGAHNLSNRALTETTANTEICIYCHTPHQAQTDSDFDYNPLWNMAATQVVYASYSTTTFDGTMDTDVLTGPSRLCMSCHDGTIAVDNAITGESDPLGGDNYIKAGKLIGGGGSLASDHPIGFDYTTSVTATPAEIAGTSVAMGSGEIGDYLFGGTIMTCATCHDVHDNANGSFLLVANDDSDLCLTCHLK
ncbi:MAG: cytochrome c3 family protein [Desulfuromusa sp.]|jgi:predicted CXXCH cytochrome family protein|nr:cytochrome c3 family protein [Desulfuromusa sp.]